MIPRMNNRSKVNLGNVLIFIGVVGFLFLLFNSAKYTALYRLKKFTDLAVTIGQTKTKSCNKSGCHVNYIYVVNGIIYGGSAQGGNNYKYPDKQYYVVYSKGNPKLQVILPDYPVGKPIDPNTLEKEYLIDRLMNYSRTDKKEDWGIFIWNELFEVKEE